MGRRYTSQHSRTVKLAGSRARREVLVRGPVSDSIPFHMYRCHSLGVNGSPVEGGRVFLDLLVKALSESQRVSTLSAIDCLFANHDSHP